MANKKKRFKGPLSSSLLIIVEYNQLISVLDKKARVERGIKRELSKAKLQRQRLVEQQEATFKRFNIGKQLAIKDGIEEGEKKEKYRTERLSQLEQKQTIDLQNTQIIIKKFEKNLNKGTTFYN